jgi:hypothetical protein
MHKPAFNRADVPPFDFIGQCALASLLPFG